MNTITGDYLYKLLPAIYRLRDEERGGALRALLEVMAEQARIMEADIERLYDNLFIETCDDWAVPYIGDLIGVQGLDPRGGTLYTPRAQVANTLKYRRRKGTATMLEQLAHDTTGWYARVIEFFELLGTTQHLDHLRSGRGGTVDVRLLINDVELLGTPFDTIPRTAEVRRIAGRGGRYNIPNIGLFLWRLNTYPLSRSTARSLSPDGKRFSFSPLGNDIPLFNRPLPEPDISHLAEEYNLPGLLRRRPLLMDLQAWREGMHKKTRQELAELELLELKKNSLYFGASPVFQIFLNGNPVFPEQILIADLSGWDAQAGDDEKIAVDPVNGRLLLLGDNINANNKVAVSYSYGFSGDMGGGPYSRQDTVAKPRLKQAGWKAMISQSGQAPKGVEGFKTLQQAVEAWNLLPAGNFGIMAIADSRTYQEPDISIAIPAGSELWIIAATWQNAEILSATELRPHLLLNGTEGKISVNSSVPAQIENAGYGNLSLNGLLIEGWLEIGSALDTLQLQHCTLVPGRSLDPDGLPLAPGQPSILAKAACVALQVDISFSIVGPLHLPTTMRGLTISDSIVDSPTMEKIPVLVSGKLTTPKLTSKSPRIELQMGDEVPIIVPLQKSSDWSPTIAQQKKGASVLKAAAAMLQAAIRANATGPVYAKASVTAIADRLVIISGLPAEPRVRSVGKDPSAKILGLTNPPAVVVWVYLTQPLSDSIDLVPAEGPSAPPTVLPAGSGLPSLPIIQANLLHRTLRIPTTFSRSMTTRLGSRGLVLPDFTAPDFESGDLADLFPPWPAIATDATSKSPGPLTVIERSTVFGAVYVKELVRASETIFMRNVRAVRQQAGCLRFCYLPDQDSSTPKRYRCQPDLALEGVSEASQQNRIRHGLVPKFTSVHYGKPAYAQLSPDCHAVILTGGEDDAEMGVFNFLLQPRREAVLRATLDEYLRAGREAGLFFVT